MRLWSPLNIGKQGWQIGIAITWVSRVNSSLKAVLKLAVKLNSEVEAISRLFEIVDNKMLESRHAKKLEYDKTKFENVIIAKNVEYSAGRK
jgi:ABC-type multidrug transport system fused ATPase/permease subunit